MPTNELPSPSNNERSKVLRRRAGKVAGALSIPVLTGGLGLILMLPGNSNNNQDSSSRPPGMGSLPFPDTSSSPTVSPTIKSTRPILPGIIDGSGSQILMPDVCDTRNSPTEGSFGQNTGVHTIYAAEGRPTIVAVTPDRSAVQQLRFKLPNQNQWVSFDPGLTGIVVQAEIDMQVDTSGNRDVWFKGCENGPDDAASEVPSRVQNEFDNFGFGCVDVVTVTKDGYIVQEVQNGQIYTQDIPSTFFPFGASQGLGQ